MGRLLAICCVLAFAAGAQAQINHPYNEVGIYTVEQPVGCETAQIDVPPVTPFTCYVVLTNPHNETLDRPVTTVGGYEFRLEIPGTVYLTQADFGPCMPPWFTGPDFLVGCPLPVTDGYVRLLGLRLMAMTGGPDLVYLTPVRDAPQSISGEMAFWDLDDDFSLHVMHPVSGSHDLPVFAINWDGELSFCETVPTRDASFGEVKALYR